MRLFPLLVFVLLSWFIAPQALAEDYCGGRYVAGKAYPTYRQCPVKAAAAPFGGMGGYYCRDPGLMHGHCDGSFGADTNEPASPEDSTPDLVDSCSGDVSAGCDNNTSGADPVNLYTGQFYQYDHDLSIADTAGGLELTRVYRSGAYVASGKPLVGPFGTGTGFNYDTILAMSTDRQRLELREVTGIRVPFTPRAGTSNTWDDLMSPGEYRYARIDTNGSDGMTLTMRDGRIRQFTMVSDVYRLSRMQDRNGNTTVIARDSKTGAVTTVTSPNGRVLSFTSVTSSSGIPLVSLVIDPLKRRVSYQYDNQDRLVQFTDAGGGVWKYGWDAQSRLTTVTDPLGNVRLTNTYGNGSDTKDRVTAQKLADGSTFGIAYTVSAGKVTRTDITDRRGSIRRLEFDATGHVVRNTYPADLPEQQVQTFAYDPTGRVIVGGRQYADTDDLSGNSTTGADPDGMPITHSFDARSQVLTDALARDLQRGLATADTYDSHGNLLTLTDRAGNRTTYGYDPQGRLQTSTDVLKGVTRYTYTGADLTAITDPLNRTTQFTTDAVGRTIAVTDPLNQTTRRTLDALDRTIDITDAAGGITRFTWDATGHMLSQVDPEGVTARYTYNGIGRPISKTDPLGHSETYTWNSAGQLATVTDHNGEVTAYGYDAAGRLLYVKKPTSRGD